jgi:glycosyltransferase involved in cell wall biosynthesis
MDKNFKVSIITVCFDAEDDIEKTIQSVLNQTYNDIEYIIVDGKSTDGTMDIIKIYENRISKIICEPDKGIYDAMNKGIRAATGDVLYFLNAGDRLCDGNIIEKVAKEFEKSKALIIYGKSLYENIPKSLGRRYTQRPHIFNNKMDVARYASPQQCFFYKREAFNQVGTFSTGLKASLL